MLVTCRVEPCKKGMGDIPSKVEPYKDKKKAGARSISRLPFYFLGGLGEISISSRPLESLDKGRL